jgi:hypothetical protein
MAEPVATQVRVPIGRAIWIQWMDGDQIVAAHLVLPREGGPRACKPSPQVIHLSRRDTETLVEALLDPPEPNEALKRALNPDPIAAHIDALFKHYGSAEAVFAAVQGKK